ncbi:MAG: hypothetical protein ABUL77_01980 [Bacteroidota bacterium]
MIALSVTVLAGCGARGGVVPDGGFPASGATPPGGCISTCYPDPGSRPVNCAQQEAGLEFLKVWDFEDGTGTGMYEYGDRSTANFSPNKYAPPSEDADRCGRTKVMHIFGGPFRGWGGGVGVGFINAAPRKRCYEPIETRPDYCPAANAEYAELTLDLSKWDGVSLWARRSPNSQSAIRVGLGDRQTDDDISFQSQYAGPGAPPGAPPRQKYCRRNRECGCANSRPCTPIDPDDSTSDRYCWDPARDPVPVTMSNERLVVAEKCGPTRCAAPYDAFDRLVDREFNGKACTPYSFVNGIASSYCFNPGVDPDPAENNELCGDSWVFPVAVSNDWHLYLIPFTQLQQQGFGKKFARPDLTAISMLRLMWDVGWVDYWVDDVGFYRVRK